MTLAFLSYFGYLIVQITDYVPLIQEYSGEIQPTIKVPSLHMCSYNSDIQIYCTFNYCDGMSRFFNTCENVFAVERYGSCNLYSVVNDLSLSTSDALDNGIIGLSIAWEITRRDIPGAEPSPLEATIGLLPPGYNFYSNESNSDDIEEKIRMTHSFQEVVLLPDSYYRMLYQYELFRKIKKHDISATLGLKPNYREYLSVNFNEQRIVDDSSANRSANILGGIFTLRVKDPTLKIREEVKQHTIFAALGLAGGCYSVLTAVYILIFGASRLTPWGLFHFFHGKIVQKRVNEYRKEMSGSDKTQALKGDIIVNQPKKHKNWLPRSLFSRPELNPVNPAEKPYEVVNVGQADSIDNFTMVDTEKINDRASEDDDVLFIQEPYSYDMQKRIDNIEKNGRMDKYQMAALLRRMNDLESLLKDYYIDLSYLDRVASRISDDSIPHKD
ncbi:hypothetical protein BDB01DRAFT_832632 [Pilobolus umbonatus]|nr:hypothetical protein BDB01DRAFT_832632 [Pilobolus umbonatus]